MTHCGSNMSRYGSDAKLVDIEPLIKQSREEYHHSAYYNVLHLDDGFTVEDYFDPYNLYHNPYLSDTWNSVHLGFHTYDAGINIKEQITFYSIGDGCPYIELNLKPDDDCYTIQADSSSQSYLLKRILRQNKARILFKRLSDDIEYDGYYYPKIISQLTYNKLIIKHGI
jgi:hypothetical protein